MLAQLPAATPSSPSVRTFSPVALHRLPASTTGAGVSEAGCLVPLLCAGAGAEGLEAEGAAVSASLHFARVVG